MKSIKLKLVAIYLALVFIVMIVSGTFMLTRIKMQETNKSLNALKLFAKNINEQVVQTSEKKDFSDNLKLYAQGSSNMHGYILNQEGKTIAPTDSSANPDTPVQQFRNAAVISAVAGVAKDSLGKDMDTQGQYKEWINYAAPVEKISVDPPGKTTYIIFTRTEAMPMNERLMEIGTTFFLTVVLALILTGVLGFLFANTLTVPIITLTKKAKEMAQGNLNQKIPVYSSDEIGQLTDSFNFMSEELNGFMSTMASEKNKMEAILHNMTDGILAYDSAGTLLHANFSCHELLNFDDIQQIPFPEMMAFLGSNIRDMSSLSPELLTDTTITLGDKFISATFTSYEDTFGQTKGLVIVLQDITRHKKLDNMRKEFVANVSHEIRTPLTTIKSYTETLIDGAKDNLPLSVEFLSVIASEADRMTLLAQDLLELSRFDNKQLLLNFTDINLITILKQCIKQNRVMAEQKNQEIIFDSKYTDFWISGDASRVNQVFTNIINNAIKYSNEGNQVVIHAEETEKYYRIYIRDSGMGIPKEDLNRVFERFYRVDKARSRAMGGTGLGLSIAKEIIEAHGGKIFASSVPGKGTTMIVRFKKGNGNVSQS